MMRRSALLFLFLLVACESSSTVTRTGSGLFAPRESSAEEEEAPRGLTLSVASIAADGTVILELRNYSTESFVFSGSPSRPRLVIEMASGNTNARHTASPFGRETHEVAAGEHLRLKTNLGDATGRVRIGIRSKEFGYFVWTDWIAR